MSIQKHTLPILAMCCVCDQVAEDGSQPQGNWKTLSTYLLDHQIAPLEYQLSHTYCPSCYTNQALTWQLPATDQRAA
jgi:hypothetical protein